MEQRTIVIIVTIIVLFVVFSAVTIAAIALATIVIPKGQSLKFTGNAADVTTLQAQAKQTGFFFLNPSMNLQGSWHLITPDLNKTYGPIVPVPIYVKT